MAELIPGLLDELVLENVVPRLPWHVRPVCRSISKSWKSRIDVHDPILQQKTREFQLPLLTGRFLILTVDEEGTILIQDEVNPSVWHRLPPLPCPNSGPAKVIAWSGIVYVIVSTVLSKLDLGRGIWKWKCFPVNTGSSWLNTFAYKGNIYKWASDGQTHVYDVTTDGIREINKWDCSIVGVLQRSEEELYYGISYDAFEQPMKLMVYESKENSWRVQGEVPRLDYRRRLKYMLVNGDCFEPAVLEGVNIVTDYYNPKLQWYNSSQGGSSWTAIDHISMIHGRMDEVWVDHGVLLCVFLEEERGFILCRGTICVANKSMVWHQIYKQTSIFYATIMI